VNLTPWWLVGGEDSVVLAPDLCKTENPLDLAILVKL
jgi:hypothetical protein